MEATLRRNSYGLGSGSTLQDYSNTTSNIVAVDRYGSFFVITNLHRRAICQNGRNRCQLMHAKVPCSSASHRHLHLRPPFPNRAGARLSRSGVQHRLSVALAEAANYCPSLVGRRISPHTLRHYFAFPTITE